MPLATVVATILGARRPRTQRRPARARSAKRQAPAGDALCRLAWTRRAAEKDARIHRARESQARRFVFIAPPAMPRLVRPDSFASAVERSDTSPAQKSACLTTTHSGQSASDLCCVMHSGLPTQRALSRAAAVRAQRVHGPICSVCGPSTSTIEFTVSATSRSLRCLARCLAADRS